MRRRILIALLALGTVGGYAAGFAHMHHSCHGNNWNGDWHNGRGYYDHSAHYDCSGNQRDSR